MIGKTKAFPRKITLFLLFILISSPAAFAESIGVPSSHYINGVPLVDQGDKPWCGPGSVTMVLQYWSVNISLQEVGSEIDPEQDGSYPYELVNYINNSYSKFFRLYGFNETNNAEGSALEELKSWIYIDHPVIVSQWLDADKKEGHYRVVVGYDSDKLYMNDPNGYEYTADYQLFNYLWTRRNSYGLVIIPIDSDGDGIGDILELNKYHTDPLDYDTDDDGLSDGEEIKKYKTDPLDLDTDDDRLNDGDEIKKYKTDPLNPDRDNDLWGDKIEVDFSVIIIFNPVNSWLPNTVLAVAGISIILILLWRKKGNSII